MSKRHLDLPEPDRKRPRVGSTWVHLSKIAFYIVQHGPNVTAKWERDWKHAELARSNGMLLVTLPSSEEYEQHFVEQMRRDGIVPIQVEWIHDGLLLDNGRHNTTGRQLWGWSINGYSMGLWGWDTDVALGRYNGIMETAKWEFEWVPGDDYIRVRSVNYFWDPDAIWGHEVQITEAETESE